MLVEQELNGILRSCCGREYRLLVVLEPSSQWSTSPGGYPIWLTRDFDQARQWLREQARGSERFGVLASSGAHRLRPEGLHVKSKVDPQTWFLNDKADVRSSFYCEEVATEFDIQGLELDWTCVCWDVDFRHVGGHWAHYSFRGTRWQQVNTREGQLYLKNAYRVLLTRARQGMVLFVPRGTEDDPTRPPAFYDQTFEFLHSCGLQELGQASSFSRTARHSLWAL